MRDKREEGYYWCFIEYRNRKDWDIMWWNPYNSNWILDGETFEPSDAKKIVEIDEKQIKRE